MSMTNGPVPASSSASRMTGDEFPVDQHHFGLGMAQDEANRSGIEPRIDRAQHGTQSRHRVMGLQHLRNVGGQDRDRIARADARPASAEARRRVRSRNWA